MKRIIVTLLLFGDWYRYSRFFFFSSHMFQNYRLHCDLGWLQRTCNKTRPALTYSALRGNISADPQRERPWLRNTETQIPRRVRLSLSLSIFIFFLFIAVISPIKVFSHRIFQLTWIRIDYCSLCKLQIEVNSSRTTNIWRYRYYRGKNYHLFVFIMINFIIN